MFVHTKLCFKFAGSYERLAHGVIGNTPVFGTVISQLFGIFYTTNVRSFIPSVTVFLHFSAISLKHFIGHYDS